MKETYKFFHPSVAKLMIANPELITIRAYNTAIYAQFIDDFFFLGNIRIPTLNFKVKSWKVYTNGNIDIHIEWEK